MFSKGKSLDVLIILALIMAACQPAATPTPQTVMETMVVTEVVEATPVEIVQVVTPTPEPTGPRTLVICQGQEPENFNDETLFSAHILEAVFDGPIDSNSFAYQPVILEKLPSLADGDAVLTSVVVKEGDIIVDINGDVVELDATAGILLIPAGGGDPVSYEGGDIEMDQLSVTFTLLPDMSVV